MQLTIDLEQRIGDYLADVFDSEAHDGEARQRLRAAADFTVALCDAGGLPHAELIVAGIIARRRLAEKRLR